MSYFTFHVCASWSLFYFKMAGNVGHPISGRRIEFFVNFFLFILVWSINRKYWIILFFFYEAGNSLGSWMIVNANMNL